MDNHSRFPRWRIRIFLVHHLLFLLLSSLLLLLQSIIVAKYYLFLSFPRLYLLSITWINKLKCFASQAQIRLNLFFFIVVYWFINALQRRSSYRMVWLCTVASSQCWPWGFAKCKHSVVKRCRPLRLSDISEREREREKETVRQRKTLSHQLLMCTQTPIDLLEITALDTTAVDVL